jgi:hypothetical protein
MWVRGCHNNRKTGDYHCHKPPQKTPEGRQRCAEAKTNHGYETRQARSDRAAAMRRLRALEDLGHKLGIMRGTKIRGRKPF